MLRLLFIMLLMAGISARAQSFKMGIYTTYADFENELIQELIYEKTVGKTAHFYTYQGQPYTADLSTIWGYRSNDALIRTAPQNPREYMVMLMGNAVLYVLPDCIYSIKSGKYILERNYRNMYFGEWVSFYISADLNSPIIPVSEPNKDEIYAILSKAMDHPDPEELFGPLLKSTDFIHAFLSYVPVHYANANGLYDTPDALKLNTGNAPR